MSDKGGASAANHVTELKVTGHLMTFEPGLFCMLQRPGARADEQSGLPGVRVTLPPGAASGRVAIQSFRADGWLQGQEDAALIRVSGAPAQVLVTIYQTADGRDAPQIQVIRLSDPAAPTARPAPPPPAAVAAAATATPVEIAAHVQRRGDVGGRLGAWIGDRGSQRWIEGFAISPQSGVAPEDIEYQAVLGRGWLSPWAEGGQYCGSRGMALPILGLRVRLRGQAAQTHRCIVSASFVDGTAIGPVENGEACATETLAPLEAFQVMLQEVAAVASPALPAASAPAAMPAVRRRAPAAKAAPPPAEPPPAPAIPAAKPARRSASVARKS
jgi:hypothetical protein